MFGPKALTTSIDRLSLEDGIYVKFFSFSAYAEDVDYRGYFCLWKELKLISSSSMNQSIPGIVNLLKVHKYPPLGK